MIVQSNIAQPQIIQRQPKFDMFLARLLALAQMGGEAMKGYHAYNVGKANQAESQSKIGEAMKFALTMPKPYGVPFLRASGAPEAMIQQYTDIQNHLPTLEYESNVRRGQKYQQSMQMPESYGGTSQTPVPASSVPSTWDALTVPPVYNGPVAKPNGPTSYYSPATDQVNFLTQLMDSNMFGGVNG